MPYTDSEELVKNSGLPASALVEVGDDHRLATPSRFKMLEACEGGKKRRYDMTNSIIFSATSTAAPSPRRAFWKASSPRTLPARYPLQMVQKSAFRAKLSRKVIDVSICIFIVVTETARVGEAHKTGINIAASLHFVASLPNTHYFEYCVEQGDLRKHLTKQAFPVINGEITVPEEPGLGVELNEEIVAKYRVG